MICIECDPIRERIDGYLDLIGQYPQLLSGHRQGVVVTDFDTLYRYSADNDVELGLLASNAYGYLVVDLLNIDGPNTDRYVTYFRWVYAGQLVGGTNVVVVAVLYDDRDPKIVLVRHRRHATGKTHLEVPRGFAEPGVDGAENALKELREETGYLGAEAQHLGSTNTDTGLTDARVSFYRVRVTGRDRTPRDRSEQIDDVSIWPVREVRRLLRTGAIDDAFTVQALALFDLANAPTADGSDGGSRPKAG